MDCAGYTDWMAIEFLRLIIKIVYRYSLAGFSRRGLTDDFVNRVLEMNGAIGHAVRSGRRLIGRIADAARLEGNETAADKNAISRVDSILDRLLQAKGGIDAIAQVIDQSRWLTLVVKVHSLVFDLDKGIDANLLVKITFKIGVDSIQCQNTAFPKYIRCGGTTRIRTSNKPHQ